MRRTADEIGGLSAVRRAGVRYAVAGFGHVASSGRCPTFGSCRYFGVGGTIVCRTIAHLRCVAEPSRRAAHGRDGFLYIGRTNGRHAVTLVCDVAVPSLLAADGCVVLECVDDWTNEGDTIALLRDVASARCATTNCSIACRDVYWAGRHGAIAYFLGVAYACRRTADRTQRFDGATGRAAVAGNHIAIVALLEFRLENAVAAEAAILAAFRTAITIVDLVSIVAVFEETLHDIVTTNAVVLAIRGAAIAVVHDVAIVAVFKLTLHDSVSTDSVVLAIRGAAVAVVHDVAIVAVFVGVIIYNPVSADFVPAIGGASVAIDDVSIVALFRSGAVTIATYRAGGIGDV